MLQNSVKTPFMVRYRGSEEIAQCSMWAN